MTTTATTATTPVELTHDEWGVLSKFLHDAAEGVGSTDSMYLVSASRLLDRPEFTSVLAKIDNRFGLPAEPVSIYEACEVLFSRRHQLPPDVIRTLHSTLFCASAARYGDLPEEWLEDVADHDTAECEAEPDLDDPDLPL